MAESTRTPTAGCRLKTACLNCLDMAVEHLKWAAHHVEQEDFEEASKHLYLALDYTRVAGVERKVLENLASRRRGVRSSEGNYHQVKGL